MLYPIPKDEASQKAERLRHKWAVAFIIAMLFPKHVRLSATLKPPPQSLGPAYTALQDPLPLKEMHSWLRGM
jgi:hypothetical protein